MTTAEANEIRRIIDERLRKTPRRSVRVLDAMIAEFGLETDILWRKIHGRRLRGIPGVDLQAKHEKAKP